MDTWQHSNRGDSMTTVRVIQTIAGTQQEPVNLATGRKERRELRKRAQYTQQMRRNALENSDVEDAPGPSSPTNQIQVPPTPNSELQSPQTCVLVVNILPGMITRPTLWRLFSKFGEIESYDVILCKYTNEPTGYGCIRYKHDREALAAIKHTSGDMVGNHLLKVSNTIPHFESRWSTLLVKGLPFTYDNEKLSYMFSACGEVVSSKVEPTDLQRTTVDAYVRYRLRSQAEDAVSKFNDFVPCGHVIPLLVTYCYSSFQSSASSPATDPEREKSYLAEKYATDESDDAGDICPYRYLDGAVSRNAKEGVVVYLFNLAADFSYVNLRALIVPIAALVDATLVMDVMVSTLCKGYAYCTFESHDEAMKVMISLNGYWYKGKNMYAHLKINNV